MTTYYAEGSPATELSNEQLRKGLFEVFKRLGLRQRVLALPPDFTRFSSRAGQLTCMVYDYYESHYESESTSFSAEGVVRTADGKEINIAVELNMSREFFTEQSINIRAGDALKDPLVINFDGNAAQLTQREFRIITF